MNAFETNITIDFMVSDQQILALIVIVGLAFLIGLLTYLVIDIIAMRRYIKKHSTNF